MASLKEEEWSSRGGHFNGEHGHVTQVSIMEENGHVTEGASLMEGEWSCYRGGQFNGERMVILWKWPV